MYSEQCKAFDNSTKIVMNGYKEWALPPRIIIAFVVIIIVTVICFHLP